VLFRSPETHEPHATETETFSSPETFSSTESDEPIPKTPSQSSIPIALHLFYAFMGVMMFLMLLMIVFLFWFMVLCLKCPTRTKKEPESVAPIEMQSESE
jgi:cytochrome bd-type quinol oxidase subunit 1